MTRVRRSFALLPLLAWLAAPAAVTATAHAAGGPGTVNSLSVFVGYAEDKEINTPNPPSFPVPWAGAPNTLFLGGTVPGSTSCGTLPLCYDAGAIRLDNSGPTAVTVSSVSVDEHSSVTGGKVFNNLWGSFVIPPASSVILTENPPPPAKSATYDNFDTSGYPNNNCTPVAVPPTVTVTVGGVATTLVDSAHVLDTGGIDVGYCQPKRNESLQWRRIGLAGNAAATLTLGPPTTTAFAGQQVTETATLLDGGGEGLPNTMVSFAVTRGPDAGRSGTAWTDAAGHATFTYTGASDGQDVVVANVTSVGSFGSNATQVMWTNDSAAGWSSADIGNATPPGSETLDPGTGTWTVQGGGSDIAGTSDQFHFLWQTLPAAGGISARIVSEGSTDPSAKAGVMLRAGPDPGSPYYAAFVTPGTGIAVQQRASQGGTTSTLVDTPGAAPAYLWVATTGSTFTTYTSSDGYTWTPIAGSRASLNLGSSVLAGLTASSHDAAQLNAVTADTVSVGTSLPPPLPPTPCPAPWTCADVGSPAPAGSQSFDPNTAGWTINAGGADIAGASDQFRFVWQPLVGDGGISAHVTSQTNTNSSAKAGVMLRASTDPGSPYYAVFVSPGSGIKVQERTAQGGTAVKLANPTGTVPVYLKVTRSAGTFTASTSPDGVTWTPIKGSTIALNLGPNLLEGMAVTSHKAGTLGTVTLDSVDVN